MKLNELELAILENCKNTESTQRRMWSVIFMALSFVVLLSYAHFTLSKEALFAIMLVYVLITTVEKLLYGKGVLAYKKLISKLAANHEQT